MDCNVACPLCQLLLCCCLCRLVSFVAELLVYLWPLLLLVLCLLLPVQVLDSLMPQVYYAWVLLNAVFRSLVSLHPSQVLLQFLLVSIWIAADRIFRC